MTDFRETKIKILSEEHSRAFQEAVFEAGGSWYDRPHTVQYLDFTFLHVDSQLRMSFLPENANYFNRHPATEIFFVLPSEGHVHAELMAQYAQDAKTHTEPWKLWQAKTEKYGWVDCKLSLTWDPSLEFRRKPKTHTVHGVEIPDLRVSPKHGDGYYLTNTSAFKLYSCHTFDGDNTDNLWTERGLTYQHTEEGKQAAILHSKAMLGIVT